MAELTEEGRRRIAEVAARHGVSATTGEALALALLAGGRTQAQFSIPELGGMGQWSQGGMVMVGDMFNNGLKARVDALCNDLASLLGDRSLAVATPAGGAWWPSELGTPASTGSQNGMRYAFFPASARLALEEAGRVTVYDTGDHMLSGFSQQQGGGRSLSFAGQRGPVQLSEFRLVSGATAEPARPVSEAVTEPARPVADALQEPASPAPTPPLPATPGNGDDVFAKLERLADLYGRGILTATEFEAKKKELLARV